MKLIIYKGTARGLRAYLRQLLIAAELKSRGEVEEVVVCKPAK